MRAGVVATGTPEEIMKPKARTPDGTLRNTWRGRMVKPIYLSNGKASCRLRESQSAMCIRRLVCRLMVR